MNMRASTTYSRESRYDMLGSSLDRSLCDGHFLVLYILPFLSSLFAGVDGLKLYLVISACGLDAGSTQIPQQTLPPLKRWGSEES